MAATVYVGIGSNIGEPLHNCLKGIDLINNISKCKVVRVSNFFRTEPVGERSQDWYVNGVAELETTLEPEQALRSLLSIEAGMGRVRRRKWESRIIDLDILLYGDEIIESNDLRVPHPLMHQRRFVLMPMAQLNPGLTHPVLGRTMADLLKDLPVDGQAVALLSDI